MLARKTMTVLLVGLLSLVVLHGARAQGKHLTDLTGRQNVTPEEIINGLKPPDAPKPLTHGLNPRARGLSPRPKGITLELASIAVTILFAFDSADILPQAVMNLSSVGTALQSSELASYRILIEGHTDNIAPAMYNLRLSEQRAASVKQYLERHFGMNPMRLHIVGRGEKEHIAANRTRQGRQKNRRVEFVNLGKL